MTCLTYNKRSGFAPGPSRTTHRDTWATHPKGLGTSQEMVRGCLTASTGAWAALPDHQADRGHSALRLLID